MITNFTEIFSILDVIQKRKQMVPFISERKLVQLNRYSPIFLSLALTVRIVLKIARG